MYLSCFIYDKHELTLWLDLPSIFPLQHWKFYCLLPFATGIRFYSSSNKWWIFLSSALPQFGMEYKSFWKQKKNREHKMRSPNKTPNSLQFKQFKNIAWECILIIVYAIRNLIWFHFAFVIVLLSYSFIARFWRIAVFLLFAICLPAMVLAHTFICDIHISYQPGYRTYQTFWSRWKMSDSIHLGKVTHIPYQISRIRVSRIPA